MAIKSTKSSSICKSSDLFCETFESFLLETRLLIDGSLKVNEWKVPASVDTWGRYESVDILNEISPLILPTGNRMKILNQETNPLAPGSYVSVLQHSISLTAGKKYMLKVFGFNGGNPTGDCVADIYGDIPAVAPNAASVFDSAGMSFSHGEAMVEKYEIVNIVSNGTYRVRLLNSSVGNGCQFDNIRIIQVDQI